MTRQATLAVALGGAIGAGLRWGAIEAADLQGGFPWIVFALNVVGSLVLGYAMARNRRHPQAIWWRDGVGIGFCGGLTTFSTFAVETAQLIENDRTGLAASYVGSSVLLAGAAVALGALLGGGIRAVDDPLEAAA